MQDPGVFNKKIDAQLDYFKEYGPQLFPSLVINNQTFRGQLEVEAVFNAICAGFYTEPHYCRKYLETNDINNIDLILMKTRHQAHHVAMYIGCIMLLTAIAFCFYRRHAKREMKKEMNQQIESAVNQYMALSNKDTEASSRADRTSGKGQDRSIEL